MKAQSQTIIAESFNVRKITMLGILSAISYVVTLLGRIPLIPVMPFLKYDPKDIVIVIAGFLLGPLSAFLISVIVSVVEMLTVSSTGPYGLFMNILSTCAFACTASLFYKKTRTMKGATIGLVLGCLLMTAMMLAWNYIITPYYMGVPRAEIVEKLLPAILPFNLLKSGLNAALTLLLYKPLTSALRRANLIPKREIASAQQVGSHTRIGTILVSLVVLATCIFLILVINHVI